MAVKVKSIQLWRRDVANRSGALADMLEPLARTGVSLQVVMGFRYPGDESRAAIELYPISGKKAAAAAQSAGLAASSIPTLLVEGDDAPGIGHAISRAIAGNRINMAFMMAQVIGRKYSAVLGFETEADARKAAALVRKAGARKRK
jgi:hypothetical protein